jgi:beta-galactosidase
VGIAVNYSDRNYEMALPAGAEVLIGSRTLKTADVLVWKATR